MALKPKYAAFSPEFQFTFTSGAPRTQDRSLYAKSMQQLFIHNAKLDNDLVATYMVFWVCVFLFTFSICYVKKILEHKVLK
jgi:hypothetical protein